MIEAYVSGNEDYERNGDMTLFPETCTVTAELNGAWYMDITHPLDPEGRWKYIAEETVIAASTFMGKKQLFRIDDVEKTDTEVSAKAYPVFFDSADDCFLLDVRPTGKTGQQALDEMTMGSRYSGESDITGGSTAYFVRRNLMDAINGEASPTFLERWGGEILYDNYTVIINERMGADRGVEIRYGKNMAAVRYRVNMSGVVTRIAPVAYNGYTLSSADYVDSPNIGKYAKIYVKEIRFEHIRMAEDAEGDAEGQVICADQEELDEALKTACEELYASGVDLPAVTLEIDLVELSNTDEYRDFQDLETIRLGDTVHCYNRNLDISTDARAIKITWDCVYNEIQSVTLGDYEPDYFREVVSNAAKIERVVSDDGSLMAERVKGILSGARTQLRIQNTVAKKQEIRAILFEDLDPESELYGALAIGTQGMEISKKRTTDGKDWEWTTAATAGGIVADAIITGLLSDKRGVNFWNLDTGEFALSAAAMVGDKSIESFAREQASREVEGFVTAVYDPKIASLQSQIDGQIETWYYDYQPTLSNIPASDWKTEADRKKHEGDMFFWDSKGYSYRFLEEGNIWKWKIITDSDITKALKEAAKAQDTADHKRRTFLITPTPPYDVGDLWMQGAKGNIMTCVTARASGDYAAADWQKKDKYTDDSAVEALDKKLDSAEEIFNRLTQDGKVQGIYLENNNLYVNASYIKSGTLVLGGANNTHGKQVIQDAQGKEIGRWDNNGIYIDGGSIYCKTSGTGVSIDGGRMLLTHGSTDVGYIGTNVISGYAAYKGLVFDLEHTGAYMTWAAEESASSAYYIKLLYSSKNFAGYAADRLYVGCDMDFQNYEIQRAYIKDLNVKSSFTIPNNTKCEIYSDINMENFTIKNLKIQNLVATQGYTPFDGSIPIVTRIESNSDGGITWYHSAITVKNGIITSAPT